MNSHFTNKKKTSTNHLQSLLDRLKVTVTCQSDCTNLRQSLLFGALLNLKVTIVTIVTHFGRKCLQIEEVDGIWVIFVYLLQKFYNNRRRQSLSSLKTGVLTIRGTSHAL